MLLYWGTLEPSGSSGLAAVRFPSPVRVQSIRVFPTDSKPFLNDSEIVAQTSPDAFFLEVFFNAQPVDVKQKQKASNAMVPTTIAYAGGQMDFAVDMGTEYATRLMIVRGTFGSVSLAVYGELASEQAPPTSYSSHPLPSVEPRPISRALDPSNSTDPMSLARQLLSLIPDAPPLPLVVRLMFCLKPTNDDWDRSDFPYIYADIEDEDEDLDLEGYSSMTSRPVSDDAPEESLRRFAERVGAAVSSKDSTQSYHIAGVLSHVACQHADLAVFLLDTLDLANIYDASHLDDLTLLRLASATSNPDIANQLNADWFLDLVEQVANNPASDKDTKVAAKQVLLRVRGWPMLEDALSSARGDFNTAVQLLREIGTDERSFGTFIEAFLTHPDIVTKLAENPVPPASLPHPPVLFKSRFRLHVISDEAPLKHEEFIAFLRAYVGVGAVLAVFAWSDSLPNKRCRERCLGIIRLWQGVGGYREITNHLLLLRQMTFRLECNLDNDPPTPSGIDTEHILLNLVQKPQAFLCPDLVKCILSVQQPLACITEDERILLRTLAIIADDGLSGATDELLRAVERPLTRERLRMLRVALAVVEKELADNEGGEYALLQTFWRERTLSIVSRFIELFDVVVCDISTYFALTPPPLHSSSPSHSHHPSILAQLFDCAHDILRLISRLAPPFPLPSRPLRKLTVSGADLFVCTDAADMLYSQLSDVCVAAQASRQTCVDAIRIFSRRGYEAEGVSGKRGSAEVVARTLLEHAVLMSNSAGEIPVAACRDPAYHLSQVFSLIDHLLPFYTGEEKEDGYWARQVAPQVLPQFKTFFRALDAENRVHMVKRLANLDRGAIGLGDWLVLEDIKDLRLALKDADDFSTSKTKRMVAQFEICSSFKLLTDLVQKESGASAWCLAYLWTHPEASEALSACLRELLDKQLSVPSVPRLVRTLAENSSPDFSASLRFAIILTLLNGRSTSPSMITDEDLVYIPDLSKSLPSSVVVFDRLRVEFGLMLSALIGPGSTVPRKTAHVVVSIMKWVLQQAPTGTVQLTWIQPTRYADVCEQISSVLSIDKKSEFDGLQSKFAAVGEDAPMTFSLIPDRLDLSISEIQSLLQSPSQVPSTPSQNPASFGQDVFGLVTVSPQTTLLRSPAVSGLTKTYSNNDFRQLRQMHSARQNTSRLPSMHVDEFEASSPTLMPLLPGLLHPLPNDSFEGPSSGFNTQHEYPMLANIHYGTG